MIIVIDARMYGLEHAGIGRYIANLIRSLEKIDNKNNYFLLLKKQYFDSLVFENINFHKVLADYNHYSLKEQFLLPFKLASIKPDMVHFPHFNVPLLWWGKQIVTVHDLIKSDSKGKLTTTRNQSIYWLKYLTYRLLISLVVKRATKVLVPSNWVKNILIERYHLSEENIIVTYEGVDYNAFSNNSKQTELVLNKLKIEKPYIIFTGSLYPHKNVSCVVVAAKELGLRLVIVSARNVFMERFRKEVEKMGAGSYVNFVGFVPDDDLTVLYSEALAFVFPSFIEGFGLPGLEAMAAGCPVVASNSSCLPEIYGNGALYFDPNNVAELVIRIEELQENKKLRQSLVARGKEQAQKYSWDQMARKTLDIYENSFSL